MAKITIFFLEKVASCLLYIFISMVFKEFGGVRLFPFSEYVAFGRTYAVHDVDDAWYLVFALSASSSVRRKTVWKWSLPLKT